MKYDQLKDYLKTTDEDQLTLTYEEMEEILGLQLPASSFQHRAWWANTESSHPHASAWIDAGWKVVGINLGQHITFVKGLHQKSDSVRQSNSNHGSENVREKDWVDQHVVLPLKEALWNFDSHLSVQSSVHLPYANEILSYDDEGAAEHQTNKFETDICIFETDRDGKWKPRIIIEGKVKSITTHDAITYSQKAAVHKSVHPYMRYGILLGKRDHHPLPGRLFRHGAQFDFMISWKDYQADSDEWDNFREILKDEIDASRRIEEILYNSRSANRSRFHTVHRPLILK